MVQFLKARRPDISASELDPNATFQAFQQGMSPIDFVNQPTIVLRSPQRSSRLSARALWISATVGLLVIVVVGLILILSKPKVVTVAELKRDKVSYNGVRVCIVGYFVDQGADGFVLSDLTFGAYQVQAARELEHPYGEHSVDQESVVAMPAPPDCTYDSKVRVVGTYNAIQNVFYIDKGEKIGHGDAFTGKEY